MANLFSIPQYIITGENAVQKSMDHIKTFGKKAFIVTDSVMLKFGNVKKLTDEMDKYGVQYFIYSEINSEPTHTMIDRGVEIYKEEQCDFLIGIGGGSPLDAMKAIGAVFANGGKISEYIGKSIDKELPPTCTIPTTAGTGSEATKVSIITNTDTGVKMLLSDPKLMANLAVVDPVFTLTVPTEITVATGIDALTHAIEAYTSVKAFSMSNLYALSAVKKIYDHIYEVALNGNNVKARTEMATAALEAGIAFSNASVTIVHGMSRPIGALFHVPHGQSNAMLLEVCLRFLKNGAIEQLNQLAKAIGVFRAEMSPEEGADAFVNAIRVLLRVLNVKTLQDFNISKEDYFRLIPKMATDALASGSPANTRRTPTKEDIIRLYGELWEENSKGA